MAKKKSIKTEDFEKYSGLGLLEIEQLLLKEEKVKPKDKDQEKIRILNAALKDRQRKIKAEVMLFEMTNNRHLLFFSSTSGYHKLAGNSVILYSQTIANRLGRKCNIRPDTDGYSPSPDGVVSVRDLANLEAQLASIDVVPDKQLSRGELFFYRLPLVYSEEKIKSLRDQTHSFSMSPSVRMRDATPAPELYMKILELQQRTFYDCRRVGDAGLRNYLTQILLDPTRLILNSYINYANNRPSLHTELAMGLDEDFPNMPAPRSLRATYLFELLCNIYSYNDNLIIVDNLKVLHSTSIWKLRAISDEVERLCRFEYNKQIKRDRTLEAKRARALAA